MSPAGILMLLTSVVAGLLAQPCARAQADARNFDYRLQARALADGVYVVEGANDDFSIANGCNIINTGFITTGAGVVVINTGPSRRYGEQLRALIARTTPEPVVQVLHLNLHPDYFMGNQAFADVPIAATALTIAGMRRDGKSYEDNLYRLCGDWMKGTEARLPTVTLKAGPLRVGSREFELHELSGHTDSDLTLIDKASGVAFAGGLVFSQRVPTTPHADLDRWLSSLQTLGALRMTVTVPSHGPVQPGSKALDETRAYLQWLKGSFAGFAEQGWEMNEVLRAPVPEPFRLWAAFPAEYVRNVAHLYPRFESQALERQKRR